MFVGNRRPGNHELSVFNPIMYAGIPDPTAPNERCCERVKTCWNRSLGGMQNQSCNPRGGVVIASGILIVTMGILAFRNGALGALVGLISGATK